MTVTLKKITIGLLSCSHCGKDIKVNTMRGALEPPTENHGQLITPAEVLCQDCSLRRGVEVQQLKGLDPGAPPKGLI